MAITDHTKQYSAADIQLYLEGKLSPADMHALEKAALDDPFLADAIEGLQQSAAQPGAGLVHTHLEDLGKRVQERIAKKGQSTPVVAFRWWQVAAAAAVIVVAGIGVYRYTDNRDQQESNDIVAQQVAKAEEKSADSIVPHTPVAASKKVIDSSVVVANNTHITPPKAEEEIVVNSNEISSSLTSKEEPKLTLKNSPAAKQEALSKQQTAAAVPQPLSEVVVVEKKAADSITVVGYGAKKREQTLAANRQQAPADYEQIVIPRSRRDSLAKGYYTKPRGDVAMNEDTKDMSDRRLKRELDKNPNAFLSGFIKGRVADQNNNPLYNAVVRRMDDDKDFLTDMNGYFKIPVSDSIVKVAVGYNGYYTQNLRLQNNTDNNITLNQLGAKPANPELNLRLRNDTVTYNVMAKENAAFKTKARTNYDNVMEQSAQPQYGWLEYHQYLDKNKKPPVQDPLTGNVTVSFLVNKKGNLSDFRIEQSLRKDYDEEAIRLIRSGPSWKLVKGSKASRATVIVNF
jgi:hypothetical protein